MRVAASRPPCFAPPTYILDPATTAPCWCLAAGGFASGPPSWSRFGLAHRPGARSRRPAGRSARDHPAAARCRRFVGLRGTPSSFRARGWEGCVSSATPGVGAPSPSSSSSSSRRASNPGRGAKAILVARVRVFAPRVPPPPRHLLVQQLDVQSHGLERVHLAQVGPRLVLGALLGAHLPPAAAGGTRPVASLRVERVQQELGLIAERGPIREHLRGPDGGVELVGVGHRRHDSRVTPRAAAAPRAPLKRTRRRSGTTVACLHVASAKRR